MFTIIGTLHLTIDTEWKMEKAHVIIVVENTTLQIARILVTRPKLKRPRRSAHIVGVVVDKMVDAVVDATVDTVENAKATTISGATIRGTGIEMIMEMVFKRGSMFGCAIYVVMSVDGMTPILLDFMPLESLILSLLICLLTMIIGNCQGNVFVSQLSLEPLREAE